MSWTGVHRPSRLAHALAPQDEEGRATSGNGGTEPKSRIAADYAPLIRSCARCEFCDKDLPGRGEAVGWDAGNFWGRCRAE